eukprot:5518585-Pyramimonas_sp.AAC.1
MEDEADVLPPVLRRLDEVARRLAARMARMARAARARRRGGTRSWSSPAPLPELVFGRLEPRYRGALS